MRISATVAIILSAFFYYGPARAEDVTQYEIQLAPNVGYSNYSGFNFGLGAKFGFALDNHWQMVTGFDTWLSKREPMNKWVGTLGLQYNFSEDWSRSFYLAGGAGYGDVKHVNDGYNSYLNKGAYGFLTFGKRISLNDAGTIAWRPEIGVEAGNFGTHDGRLTINPLNFSWSF